MGELIIGFVVGFLLGVIGCKYVIEATEPIDLKDEGED